MKVNTSKSKNAESFYIKQSYIDANGKSTSRTIRKLGTLKELLVEHGPTRDDVMAWAKEQGIHITSYMTLAYGKALKDEVIIRIAEKHNATAAQVILAWAMGEGYAVIPSSTRRENLASNLLALDLHLDDDDKKAIAALECNDRLVSPEGLAPDWD